MPLTLTIRNFEQFSSGARSERFFGTGTLRIGRSPECDWVLPDPDRLISPVHCIIESRDQDYTITDTSTNGVFLNNDGSPLGRDHVAKLRNGDLLRFADYEIEVHLTLNEGQRKDHGSNTGKTQILGSGGPCSGIDFHALLTPLSAEAPCGEDLEYDPEFGELERAAKGRPDQEFGDTVVEAQPPLWQDVERRSLDLFRRTKDLRVAVLLAKAVLITHGFEAFSGGLYVVRELLERYWDELHPRLDPEDDGDVTSRVNILKGLADPSEFLPSLRSVSLIRHDRYNEFTLRDIERTSGDKTDGNAVNETVTSADFADLLEFNVAVQRSLEHLEAIEQTIIQRTNGAQSVGLVGLTNALNTIQELFGGVVTKFEESSPFTADVGQFEDLLKKEFGHPSSPPSTPIPEDWNEPSQSVDDLPASAPAAESDIGALRSPPSSPHEPIGAREHDEPRQTPYQDIYESARDQIARLVPGAILYNPPDKMRVGTKERVTVRIGHRDLEQQLKENLSGRGAPQIDATTVGTFMRVRLFGPSFHITTLSDENQLVLDTGFAEWLFDVIPQTSGQHVLELLVTVRIKLPDADEAINLPVLQKEISVTVNRLWVTKQFVGQNWKWFAGGAASTFVAIVGYFAKRWLDGAP